MQQGFAKHMLDLRGVIYIYVDSSQFVAKDTGVQHPEVGLGRGVVGHGSPCQILPA